MDNVSIKRVPGVIEFVSHTFVSCEDLRRLCLCCSILVLGAGPSIATYIPFLTPVIDIHSFILSTTFYKSSKSC